MTADPEPASLLLPDLLPAGGRGPRRGVCRVRGLGARARPAAVPAPGRGDAGPAGRGERRPVDPDRVGQVPGRDRRAPRRAGHRPGELLHGADQGPGEREVLRPLRDLRRLRGRHAHRRRVGEPRCAHHLLHRRDPRQPGAARGHRRRCRPGRHGRVPLLCRAGPRLGLAGATAGAPPGPVRADVGDARRHQRDLRRPLPPHRPTHRPGDRHRTPGAAELLVGAHSAARDDRGAAHHPPGARSTSSTSPRRQPWSRRRRCSPSSPRSRPTRTPSPSGSAASGSPRGSAGRCPSSCARASACTMPGCCRATAGSWSSWPRTACSRSSAAPTPWAWASTCRSGRCSSPVWSSSTARGSECSRRASSTRSPGAQDGPATTPAAPSSSRRPSTSSRTPASSPRPATTPRSSSGSSAASPPTARCRGRSRPTTSSWPPSQSRSCHGCASTTP